MITIQRIGLLLLGGLLLGSIARGIYKHAHSTPTPKKETTPLRSSYEMYLQGRDSLFVHDTLLIAERWDTLVQPAFWEQVIGLSPDTALVNVAETRQILMRIPTAFYMDRDKESREAFKDSVRTAFQLSEDEEVYITTGKRHYYQFGHVWDSLHIGIQAFKEEGVDPWYAQVILMIESPNRLRTSPVGAYGAFQLMKGIAQQYGLVVNAKVDERADLAKSAKAAAKLIKTVCIPKAKAILSKHKLHYKEDDLWFRLMVLHVYHAGARNVEAVILKINPKEGGIALFRQLWKTQTRRFGNASQNYSQVALASQLIFDKMIREKYQLSESSFLWQKR